MLKYELLPDGILVVTPKDRLEVSDFEAVADIVDRYIDDHGKLAGLLITAESFPGWDSFGAMIAHLRFVKNHHQKITRVAAVSDGHFLSIMPNVVDHFTGAQVRHFDFKDREKALEWIRS